MSQQFVGGDAEAEAGLSLDHRHTLVAVQPEALEALWRPASGGALGWLLFRSGSSAPAQEPASSDIPPKLWFAGSGQRAVAEVAEAAGWGEPGAAAVALFELPSGADLELGQPTKCGIELDGEEVSADLPPAWIGRLRAARPKTF